MGQVLSYNFFHSCLMTHTHFENWSIQVQKGTHSRGISIRMMFVFSVFGGKSEPPGRTVKERYVVDWGDWQKFWMRVGSAEDAKRRDSTCLRVRSTEAEETWQFQAGEFYDWEKQPLATKLLLVWFVAISYGQFHWLQSELSGCNMNFLDHNVVCKQSSDFW